MEDSLTELAGHALMAVLILSAPAVLVGMTVGFIISLFQAVTQIQEQTLTFVPKIIAVFLILLVTGGWMISQIQEFTGETYKEVAALVRT
jgi:flagellar biosynthetic protein FliQ